MFLLLVRSIFLPISPFIKPILQNQKVIFLRIKGRSVVELIICLSIILYAQLSKYTCRNCSQKHVKSL